MKKKPSRVVPTPDPAEPPPIPPGESLYHPKHWKKTNTNRKENR